MSAANILLQDLTCSLEDCELSWEFRLSHTVEGEAASPVIPAQDVREESLSLEFDLSDWANPDFDDSGKSL